jgi:hypothetical protein
VCVNKHIFHFSFNRPLNARLNKYRSQANLLKCLSTLKSGYKLDCNGRDMLCCRLFQRPIGRPKSGHRKPKVIKERQRSLTMDFDFKKLYNLKKDVHSLINSHHHENDDSDTNFISQPQTNYFNTYEKPQYISRPITTSTMTTTKTTTTITTTTTTTSTTTTTTMKPLLFQGGHSDSNFLFQPQKNYFNSYEKSTLTSQPQRNYFNSQKKPQYIARPLTTSTTTTTATTTKTLPFLGGHSETNYLYQPQKNYFNSYEKSDFISQPQTNYFNSQKKPQYISRPLTTSTTTTTTTTKKPSLFLGGHRRGIVVDENEANKKSTKEDTLQERFDSNSFVDHNVVGPYGYDRGLCATLLVPCRFVNDHPCCRFEMPLDLVARARALDGSADLRWRPQSLGEPRNGPQGRSLFNNLLGKPTKTPVINRNIRYNHANSKLKVRIPKYHYDGGPEMTSTIVGLCWRLHYLRCPAVPIFKNGGHWIDTKTLKQVHPCCQLLSKPSGSMSSPVESRLSRWLHHSPRPTIPV